MTTPQTPIRDPEIGQVGCPLMVLSVAVGLALAVVVSVFAGVPDWGARDYELTGRAIVLIPAALTVSWAIWYVADLLGRTRILRRWADAALLVIWLAVPAAIVLAVLLAPAGRDLFDAIWFATVGICLVAVLRAALGRLRAGPPSVGQPHSARVGANGRLANPVSLLDLPAAEAVLERVAQLRPEELTALRRARSAEISIAAQASWSPLFEAEAAARHLAGPTGTAHVRAMVRRALTQAERRGPSGRSQGPMGRLRAAWRRRTAAPPLEDVVLVAALGNALPFDVALRLMRAWDAVEGDGGGPAMVEGKARQRYAQRNVKVSLALLASGAVALPVVAFSPPFAGLDPTIREAVIVAGGVAWLVAAGALVSWRRREERRLYDEASGPGLSVRPDGRADRDGTA